MDSAPNFEVLMQKMAVATPKEALDPTYQLHIGAV
jgi:hypothetical protein